MRVFFVMDMDVRWVGLTIRRLGGFGSFPFSFQSGGDRVVAWVTFFFDGAISVAQGCFEESYWMGRT